MPSKYILRDFRDNSVYHVFNRGVENKKIFLDEQDFRVFLFYINIYTSPAEIVKAKYSDLPRRLQKNSLAPGLKLLGYCLMPDHFHLLLRQETQTLVPRLMKQVANGYTIYFNNKYKRLGNLMQGRYKAALVSDDLVRLMLRYIHLDPVQSGLVETPEGYEWSSYRHYIGENGGLNCDTETVLSQFGSTEEFVTFHQTYGENAASASSLGKLTIEELAIK